MKKFICLIMILVMCTAIVVPAYATQCSFVPSITHQSAPEIVPVTDENGEVYLGVIHDVDGNIIDYIDADCLRITPVSHIWDKKIDMPAEIKQRLTLIYDDLNSNEMELPYYKFDANLDHSNTVVRDLFDISWRCENHCQQLLQNDATFDITFNLGMETDVFALTYDEETSEWSAITKTVNNGDGTITCTFSYPWVVTISIPASAAQNLVVDAPSTGNTWLWIILTILIFVGAAVILLNKNKKKKRHKRSR